MVAFGSNMVDTFEMNSHKIKPVFAIDAGNKDSGYAILVSKSSLMRVVGQPTFGKISNEDLLVVIKGWIGKVDFAIEFPYPKNSVVPYEVFEMAAWVGRMEQVIIQAGEKSARIFRHREKSVMCRSGSATDAQIRAAVIDLMGGKGTPSNPGPTFGVTADVWQAIAVGVTFIQEGDSWDRMRALPKKPKVKTVPMS